MNKLLLDTNILIDHLRGYEKALIFLEKNFNKILISSLTVAELYSGVVDGEARERLESLIELFKIIPLTTEIAIQGGLYFRQYYKSHGIDIVDALLAATASENKLTLMTRNKKHFPMFKNIKVPY